ncbi:MAG: flippase-like domain-containing protein [Deltaproteobacteria bacterium]|nr:flippase-like domain-containing protein [Deltaproteobacteria bacterium]
MPGFWRKVLAAMAIAVLVFASFSIYGDARKLLSTLHSFPLAAMMAALALAAGNYLIRFVRWELYLKKVGVSPPKQASALVFVSGFAMSVTPGKVGELLKAALLKETAGVTMARTAPIVVAERLTDLVSLLLLALAGALAYGVGRDLVVAGSVCMVLGLVTLSYRPLAHRLIDWAAGLGPFAKLAPKAREMYDNLAELVRPAPLAWATAMGLMAWLLECVGFALIIQAFPGASVTIGLATLIYAIATLAGALSFLPAGLIMTEASMLVLLMRWVPGIDKPAAVAATLLIRLCTLWFAVVLGLFAVMALRRAFPSTARAMSGVGSERDPV